MSIIEYLISSSSKSNTLFPNLSSYLETSSKALIAVFIDISAIHFSDKSSKKIFFIVSLYLKSICLSVTINSPISPYSSINTAIFFITSILLSSNKFLFSMNFSIEMTLLIFSPISLISITFWLISNVPFNILIASLFLYPMVVPL